MKRVYRTQAEVEAALRAAVLHVAELLLAEALEFHVGSDDDLAEDPYSADTIVEILQEAMIDLHWGGVADHLEKLE